MNEQEKFDVLLNRASKLVEAYTSTSNKVVYPELSKALTSLERFIESDENKFAVEIYTAICNFESKILEYHAAQQDEQHDQKNSSKAKTTKVEKKEEKPKKKKKWKLAKKFRKQK